MLTWHGSPSAGQSVSLSLFPVWAELSLSPGKVPSPPAPSLVQVVLLPGGWEFNASFIHYQSLLSAEVAQPILKYVVIIKTCNYSFQVWSAGHIWKSSMISCVLHGFLILVHLFSTKLGSHTILSPAFKWYLWASAWLCAAHGAIDRDQLVWQKLQVKANPSVLSACDCEVRTDESRGTVSLDQTKVSSSPQCDVDAVQYQITTGEKIS